MSHLWGLESNGRTPGFHNEDRDSGSRGGVIMKIFGSVKDIFFIMKKRIRALSDFRYLCLIFVIVLGFVTIIATNCGDSGSVGLSVDDGLADYRQALAEYYAPYLRFDSQQGKNSYCFPSDAEEYYNERMSGNDDPIFDRICNTDYSQIERGEVPIYYEYHKCKDEIIITSVSDSVGIGCVTLYAGQTIEAGTVCIEQVDTEDMEQLRVTYTTIDGWELVEAHLWIGEDLTMMPQKVEHFPYHSDDITGLTSYSFFIDPIWCTDVRYAAAHAIIRKNITEGSYRTETAWASGPQVVERGNWATYFTFEMTCTEYIYYWFFYGYQNACLLLGSIPVGAHDSDWEHIIVKVVDGELDRVMFYQHSGWFTKLPGNYEIFTGDDLPGEHPVVYVGKKSHGSYHEAFGGPEFSECCYFRDFHKPGDANKHMHTELNLVHLSLSEDSPEWMKYDRSWKNWNEAGEGPLGPLFQGPIDRCSIPGCYGSDTRCDLSGDNQQGCLESDLPEDEPF